MTPGNIVNIVYTDTPAILKAAAELNVTHHLDKLVKERRIRRNEDTYIYVEPGKI